MANKKLLYLLFALPCGLGASSSSGTKPQMGWNSWNTFKYAITQDLVQETATLISTSGLKDAGYSYILIDAGWQALTRDSNNKQQPNGTKFPDGIKAVSDYVHHLGLKIGIYSDAGIYDCGFYPGSWGYEELDAATYAEWDIDYLKYDNCGGFEANTHAPQDRFLRMSDALKKTGRDIFYSLCEWGHQFPWFWADQFTGSYRMSGDIHQSFATDGSGVCKTAYCLNTGYAGVSVLTMIRKMRELSKFQKPGAWADMDMLEIGTGSMTQHEEETHFTFWSALKSPLIIGADLSAMNKTSLDILLNKEVIAINQDEAAMAVDYFPALSVEGKVQVWGGPLADGKKEYVILVLNEGNNSTDYSFATSGFGIDGSSNGKNSGNSGKYKIRDVWAKKDLGTLGQNIALKGIESHQTKVLVVSSS